MKNEIRHMRCSICKKRKHEVIEQMSTYFLLQCMNCNAIIMIEKKEDDDGIQNINAVC